MNVPRYEFCQENQKYLLEFLKTAVEQKNNKYCKLTDHHSLSKIIPLDEKLQDKLNEYTSKQTIVIDITDDEGDKGDDNIECFAGSKLFVGETETAERVESYINQSTVDDIINSIKEHLETKKFISSSILNNLNESEINEEIFVALTDLNSEQVFNFGNSLQTTRINNEVIISYYIRYLLVKKLTSEYSEQLQTILCEFSAKYSNIMLDELTTTLLSSEGESRIFLQFIDGLSLDFKTKLCRKFIFSCESFKENYIAILDVIINTQVEYNTLNKLVDIFSNCTSRFTINKYFGKLLIKVIKLLGKNVATLERPLKHIIGSHKSIWNSRIQKAFDDCLQDSSLHSQTFRY